MEGVYPVDGASTRVLRVIDGTLTAQRTGGERKKLIPIGRDDYLYEDGLNRFTIDRYAHGVVTAMQFFAEGEAPAVRVPRSTATLPANHQAVPLTQAQVERVLGSYRSSGPGMKVFVDGDHVMAQLAGQPPVDIFAESADRFFMTAVDATLEFGEGPAPATTMTLKQGGQALEFSRM